MKNKDGVADLHPIEVDVLDLGASIKPMIAPTR